MAVCKIEKFIYSDRVFGRIEIDEPVILEIINTQAFQRLKGVNNGGYEKLAAKIYTKVNSYDNTRYDHSIGVYYLLRKFGASIEEQIAGLIHDVSHMTFSHVADYVFKEGSEKTHSHQDNIHEEFVKNSEIAEIVKKYGFDLEYILNEKNFPLKEKNIPDLCADRIEYSLKTAALFQERDKYKLNEIIDSLLVQNKMWVFKNYDCALKFAKLFSMLNKIYWSGLESAYMFRVTADCLKYALGKEYITKDDLYTTDAEVISKIKNHLDDDELMKFWNRMDGKTSYENNPNDYDSHIFVKSRVVDPLCKHNGLIKRVSDVDEKWGKRVIDELQPEEYFIKFKN